LFSCSQILAEGLVQFERGSKCTYAETYSRYKPDLEWIPARERTLLPLVREMYVAIAPRVYNEPRGPNMCYNFQTTNLIVTDNATKELGYKNLLPHIQRISVEVRTWLMADCDDNGICLPCYEEPLEHSHQSIGSTYEGTHFCIELPKLQRSSRGRRQERVPNLASLARMLPQLQAHLIELGKSFMVTHVTENDQKTDGQHWAIRDWIDASTLTWHMTMKPGKFSGSSFAETLKHDGLQNFRTKELKRTPAVVGRYAEEVFFRRDHISKAGHSSWSCHDTGKTVWTQDGSVRSQSGYMRADADVLQMRFDNVFDELRTQQPEIAPVVEGISPRSLHPGFCSFVCRMGGGP
jgi:hypothetical protein